MKANMGTADRLIRLLAAIAIAFLYFTHRIGGTLALVLGVVAVIFLATASIGFCPAYLPFGWSTCKTGRPSGAS